MQSDEDVALPEESGRKTRSRRSAAVKAAATSPIPARASRRTKRKADPEVEQEVQVVVEDLNAHKAEESDPEPMTKSHETRQEEIQEAVSDEADTQQVMEQLQGLIVPVIEEQKQDENSSTNLFEEFQSDITQLDEQSSTEKDEPISTEHTADSTDNVFIANLAAEENANSFPSVVDESESPEEIAETETPVTQIVESAEKHEEAEKTPTDEEDFDMKAEDVEEEAHNLDEVSQNAEDIEMSDAALENDMNANTDSESNDITASSGNAIAESLENGIEDSKNTTVDLDAEMVSEDELPVAMQPKVQDAEEVSDEELPGPKLAELPADTEVVSEDELPSSNKKDASKPVDAELPADTEIVSEDELPANKKETSKRKLNEDYDPSCPTETTEAPEKKTKVEPVVETEPEKEKKKVLPELDKYWKAVNDDSTDFTAWTYLLQYVDQENDIEAAREAYDAFLAHYPYCYGYWRKYADYEKRKGNKKKCEEVFERGLKAIPLSVDLWIHYLTHVKTNHAEDEAMIRSQFERALGACGLEFRSDKLWEAYIKWENEGKHISNIVAIYDRLLVTPTQGYNNHFDNFKEVINNNPVHTLVSTEEFLKLRHDIRESLRKKAEKENAERKKSEVTEKKDKRRSESEHKDHKEKKDRSDTDHKDKDKKERSESKHKDRKEKDSDHKEKRDRSESDHKDRKDKDKESDHKDRKDRSESSDHKDRKDKTDSDHKDKKERSSSDHKERKEKSDSDSKERKEKSDSDSKERKEKSESERSKRSDEKKEKSDSDKKVKKEAVVDVEPKEKKEIPDSDNKENKEISVSDHKANIEDNKKDAEKPADDVKTEETDVKVEKVEVAGDEAPIVELKPEPEKMEVAAEEQKPEIEAALESENKENVEIKNENESIVVEEKPVEMVVEEEKEADDHVNSEEEATAIKDKIISRRKKLHKATVSAVTSRWTFEEGIKRPYFHVKPLERCQLKNWKEYLDFEIEQGDQKRVLVLFERCLIACALYDEFWLKLIRFLDSKDDPEILPKTRDAFERACTIHHPDKPSLHLMWSAFEEANGNINKASDILINIEKINPNLMQVSYRRINLERRRGDYDKCVQLYDHYVAQAKNKTIAGNVAIKYARFLHKLKHDINTAYEVLRSVLEKDPSNTRVALQMIDLALQKDHVNETEIMEIMDSFMARECIEADQKVLFAQRKVEFLEDFGSTAKGLQEAQRALQSIMNKANEAKKKSASSEQTPKKSSKDTAATTQANTSYTNSYNYTNAAQNQSYYASGTGTQSSGYQAYGDGYNYNQWNQQYSQSQSQAGYGNYSQWSGYGSYY